jgi:hypothetical protein
MSAAQLLLLPVRARLLRRISTRAAALLPAPPPETRPRAAHGRSRLDFSEAPEAARRPDLLLLDGTYFACCSAVLGARGGAAHAAALATLLRGALEALQPRVTLVAFDSGARKPAVPGSADGRRARSAEATGRGSPTVRRGSPAPLAAALAEQLGIVCLVVPAGLQADDALVGCAGAAAAAAVGPACNLRRVLLASGDEDLCVALRRGGPGAPSVAWLRCAGHPTSRWPRRMALVSWEDYLRRRGYPAERHALAGALLGRPRDGAAGLHGVGARGAAAVLKAFGGEALRSDEQVLAELFAVQPARLRGWTPTLRGALAAPGAHEAARRSLELTKPRDGWQRGDWHGCADWPGMQAMLLQL